MSEQSKEVLIGAQGHLYVAPLGTTMPSDLSALALPWVELGYTSENGVTATFSQTTLDVPSWQAFYFIRRKVTSRDAVFKTALRQWNKATLLAAFSGGTITDLGGGLTKFAPPAPDTDGTCAMVLDVIDGTHTYRWLVPGVLVTEQGDTSFNRQAASDLPVGFGLVVQPGLDPFDIITNDPNFGVT